MSTTAFTILIVPAFFAVPVGLALGCVAEWLLESFGALFASDVDGRERGVGEGRDGDPGRFGPRREPIRRDRPAFPAGACAPSASPRPWM